MPGVPTNQMIVVSVIGSSIQVKCPLQDTEPKIAPEDCAICVLMISSQKTDVQLKK